MGDKASTSSLTAQHPPSARPFPGVLIVVEGIDGGKEPVGRGKKLGLDRERSQGKKNCAVVPWASTHRAEALFDTVEGMGT